MSGLLNTVDQRTQLAGHNRLELLLFRLSGEQLYGINVFKVKEVMQCPAMTVMPKSHPVVRGLAHIRGETIPVIDLSKATGRRALEDVENCFLIVTEYNRRIQGFLVKMVDRIVNLNWEEIHPPPSGTGREHYLTAVTQIDEKLVEIIDVEKVLAEVAPVESMVSSGLRESASYHGDLPETVLVADDSLVARKQICKALGSIGIQSIELGDGKQALQYLKTMVLDGKEVNKELLMVISDIEMPEMDGYTLTTEIRNDPRLSALHVVLHSSLSGGFNEAMVRKVGADRFLSKFNPDELAQVVMDRIQTLTG